MVIFSKTALDDSQHGSSFITDKFCGKLRRWQDCPLSAGCLHSNLLNYDLGISLRKKNTQDYVLITLLGLKLKIRQQETTRLISD